MFRRVLKSKIHCATVTGADVGYEGSITIDRGLMDAAGLVEYEEVAVWSVTGGQRLETYVIAGPGNTGTVMMNGAAAHLVKEGDVVIIASYATVSEDELTNHEVRKVFVDGDNRVVRTERQQCTRYS